jgi:hypothetical protein
MTPTEEARISFPEKTRLAVIDLDGTLLKGLNAERVFYLHLLVHGRVGVMRMAAFLLPPGDRHERPDPPRRDARGGPAVGP